MLLLAPVSSARAATWSEVFAAESDTAVFLGRSGELLLAPFHLAARETLWRPQGKTRINRLLVAPGGGRVAWLARESDESPTDLWVGGRGPVRRLANFFSLIPSRYRMLRYEPGVPTTEDPVIRGARLVSPGPTMRRSSSNGFEWTPDGRRIVFAYEGGLILVDPDSGSFAEVGKGMIVRLRSLDPAPICLVEMIKLGRSKGISSRSGGEESSLELMRENISTAGRGDFLLYPTAREWKIFETGGLGFREAWTASPGTVWWVDAKKQIRAVRAHDPRPTVESMGSAPVPWLEYAAAGRALRWVRDRRVLSRAEEGGAESVVFETASPILRVLAPPRGSLRGLVSADSLVLWEPQAGTRRAVALAGAVPEALFADAEGHVMVVGETPNRGSPPIFRLDASGTALARVTSPGVRGATFAASPSGARVLMFHAEGDPAPTLQVYDIAGGTWTEVSNPGIAGWEPLTPR